jgi:hypothetical protein
MLSRYSGAWRQPEDFFSIYGYCRAGLNDRNILLLIKSVITSKDELAADEARRLKPLAVGRDGDQENLRLQAPIAMT